MVCLADIPESFSVCFHTCIMFHCAVGLDQIVSGRGMTSSFTVGSIAEDEEEGGIGENGRLNITGHSSGFISESPCY